MRKAFHALVWSRLPRNLRRAALFGGTRLAAPRPDRDVRPAEPVVVVGALRSATGLGQSARLCHDALLAAGYDVRGVDVSTALFQPLDLPDYPFRDGSACAGPGTLIVHVNAPLLPLTLLALGRRLVAGKWVVGYWAWELPVVPRDWSDSARFVHEIWVPSRFTAHAVRARMATRPVRVLAHPVAVSLKSHVPRPRRATEREFTVLTLFNMGSSFARKNPLGAVAAFRRAFADDPRCRLIVKASNPDLYPEGARALRNAVRKAGNITLLEATMSPAQIADLYAQADCLVSLHRAEGFGLAVAEAMLRAVPAVSTDWSGTTDFVSRENGAPMPFRLVPARDPQGEYEHPDLRWADADLDAAAAALASLRDPARRTALGEAARTDARARFGASTYAEAVARFFADAHAGRPS